MEVDLLGRTAYGIYFVRIFLHTGIQTCRLIIYFGQLVTWEQCIKYMKFKNGYRCADRLFASFWNDKNKVRNLDRMVCIKTTKYKIKGGFGLLWLFQASTSSRMQGMAGAKIICMDWIEFLQ